MTITCTDAAGNSTLVELDFVVAIPVVEDVYRPDAPPIVPGSLLNQNILTRMDTKVLDFDRFDVVIDLEKAKVISDVLYVLRRFEPVSINAVIPMKTKKDTIYKLVYYIYELDSSSKLNGSLEITLPYESRFVKEKSKLAIACYNEKKRSWILVEGDVNKKDETISFKLKDFSYFMVVEN